MALAASSKHIIQIIQLLDERNLSFSLCLNKNELITLSGFGLLFQGLDLDQDGKLIKDSQRLVCSVIEMLERSSAPGAQEFRRIGCSLISVKRPPSATVRPSLSPHNSEGGVIAERSATDIAINRIQPITSNAEPSLKGGSTNESRRATAPTISLSGLGFRQNNHSQISLSSDQSLHPRSEPSLSPSRHRHSVPNSIGPKRLPVTVPPLTATTNLDYLSFDSAPVSNRKSSRSNMEKYPHQDPLVKLAASPPSDWEKLLGSIDNGQTNIYDNIYGGPPVEGLLTRPYSSHNHASSYSLPSSAIAGLSATSLPASTSAACDYLGFDSKHSTWTPEIWQYASSLSGAPLPTTQSVLSFSDESLTSGEEFSSEGSGSADRSYAFNAVEAFKGIMMPCLSPQGSGVEGGEEDGLRLEGNFVL